MIENKYQETDIKKLKPSESQAMNLITNILIDILNQLKEIQVNTENSRE